MEEFQIEEMIKTMAKMKTYIQFKHTHRKLNVIGKVKRPYKIVNTARYQNKTQYLGGLNGFDKLDYEYNT